MAQTARATKRIDIVVHTSDANELFDNIDTTNFSLHEFQAHVEARVFKSVKDLLVNPCLQLFSGPNVSEPLDDAGCRQIIASALNGSDRSVGPIDMNSTLVIRLWLREFKPSHLPLQDHSSPPTERHDNQVSTLNHFDELYDYLLLNSKSVEQQNWEELFSTSNDSDLQNHHTSNAAAAQPTRSIPDVGNNSSHALNPTTANHKATADTDKHQFIENVRREQKVVYKSDLSPSTQPKKKKKSPASSRPEKLTTKKKKYIVYIQAEKPEHQKKRGMYPIVRLPSSYYKLVKKGKTVRAYIAAVVRVNGRLHLHPLKGFLVDRKNLKIPLENPYVMELKLTKRNVRPNGDYTLKLNLLNIPGDINRKYRLQDEFNENLNLSQRTVDEQLKSLGNNEDVKRCGKFRLAIVLAKGDELLKADWDTLIVSHAMTKAIYKSNEEKATPIDGNQPATTSQVQEEEDDDYDDDEEENDDDDN